MNAPLTLGKFSLDGRSIILAGTLAILMSIAPHQASAKGGIKSCCLISGAEAAPMTSPRSEPTTEILSVGCGGEGYRKPVTHPCCGPPRFCNLKSGGPGGG